MLSLMNIKKADYLPPVRHGKGGVPLPHLGVEHAAYIGRAEKATSSFPSPRSKTVPQ